MKANSVVSILFSAVMFLVLSGAVTASWKDSSASLDETIPKQLDVPDGHEVQQMLFGTGVQIYTYNSTAWVLTNVSADLYNFKGKKVGHHFFLGQKDAKGGQASWETFHPYSIVSGKTLADVPSPTDDAIAWLLVEKTTSVGSKMFFGSTTLVQRLYTQHGLPPSASFPATEGDVFNSNYSALYKFSKNGK